MKKLLKRSPSVDLGVMIKLLKSPQTRKGKEIHIAKIGAH